MAGTIRKKIRDEETGEEVVGTVLDVVESRETYSRILLEDGTLIRVRPVIVEVVRIERMSEDGKPAYKIDGQLVMSVHPPEEQSDE